jgi:hypothetical protein
MGGEPPDVRSVGTEIFAIMEHDRVGFDEIEV